MTALRGELAGDKPTKRELIAAILECVDWEMELGDRSRRKLSKPQLRAIFVELATGLAQLGPEHRVGELADQMSQRQLRAAVGWLCEFEYLDEQGQERSSKRYLREEIEAIHETLESMPAQTTAEEIDREALREYTKGELIADLLEHVGYDRSLGEGMRGVLWIDHLRALLEHAREHAAVDVDELDEPAQLGVTGVLENLEEDRDQVEFRLVLAALAGCRRYRDRIIYENGIYRATEGRAQMYRKEELLDIVVWLLRETPAATDGDRDE